MALVESVTVPLNSKMPAFSLTDPSGQSYDSKTLTGPKGLLIAFTCNHCPYAIAVWPRLIHLAAEAKEKGVNTVAINPNIHPDYPEDAPSQMISEIKKRGISFPYLIDETQATAKLFNAQCTPDLYLYDTRQKLVYHGRFDDNWQDESKVKKQDLKDAIQNLAAGKPIAGKQFPSMGCSIKWRD
ncbi:MAG: thioredoxin family protein [Candidatus Omnitrophica bacterium CG11_big_fil_rev_8_21_14_0_20_45_26]|uniref:Thioredoxin family protein n=1 Tax=Candidatus Abzuiibacterium crystallinum TaxID=1974748 RepID=A0A2H0LKN7_9BACT|nr:MAG: thioredoxin family protein [Candidatus Omnitrophica bacterium CG11_big_fil_rev_8_21_14_0_20_45_26]PIW63933.1 MAG: thioredoxin family protein [Candidatus Omnitrophica bacterium CG12_big_fil_rev_8_21_14_0_65_45_16]